MLRKTLSAFCFVLLAHSQSIAMEQAIECPRITEDLTSKIHTIFQPIENNPEQLQIASRILAARSEVMDLFFLR